MKTMNSLSGGKTSSYMAMHHPADYEVFSLVCIDDPRCAPKDLALTHYAQAKLEKFTHEYGEFIATAEDDRTIKVMMDLEQLLGKEIIWVRGKSFNSVIDEPDEFGRGRRTRLPSWARRYCTLEMKLVPVFRWCWFQLGEKVKMRIGFRFDEYNRLENFFNNNEKGFRIPIACSTKGKRLQRFEKIDWRFCTMPLVRDVVRKEDVAAYWQRNGWLGGGLFDGPRRQIDFPAISNCIFCFHKKPETLRIMAAMHPEKMQWAAEQEEKGMGTWHDSKFKYENYLLNAGDSTLIEELINDGAVCDSGGCTD